MCKTFIIHLFCISTACSPTHFLYTHMASAGLFMLIQQYAVCTSLIFAVASGFFVLPYGSYCMLCFKYTAVWLLLFYEASSYFMMPLCRNVGACSYFVFIFCVFCYCLFHYTIKGPSSNLLPMLSFILTYHVLIVHKHYKFRILNSIH